MDFFKKYLSLKYIVLSAILSTFFVSTTYDIYSQQNNEKFKDHVVFYCQHQDDEVLWAGSAIINAINEVGRDNVYVVLVSNGSGIAVFDKYKKYENLKTKDKIECRNREFLASTKSLGVKPDNTIILPKTNSNGDSYFESMENIAIEFENKFKSVTHIAHTYKLDDHLQHIKNGSVIQGLYNAGKIKDAKYFIKPKYEDKITMKNKIIYTVKSEKDYNKIKNACEQYKFIDSHNFREGIGYKSDHKSFDKLLKNRTAPSILHTPYL
jgi:hypothetical protein